MSAYGKLIQLFEVCLNFDLNNYVRQDEDNFIGTKNEQGPTIFHMNFEIISRKDFFKVWDDSLVHSSKTVYTRARYRTNLSNQIKIFIYVQEVKVSYLIWKFVETIQHYQLHSFACQV